MAKFLMEYTHVQEVTYREWVEADTEEEAMTIECVNDIEVDFTNGLGTNRLEVIDTID